MRNIFLCLFCSAALASGVESAASLNEQLRHLSVDPEQTYRVRELQLARGDIKIYLNEGILTFAKPVAGRTIAAVFTTDHSEAGDGEILVLPADRGERASLSSFSKTPNLDEHIHSAVFFFSDETAAELLAQIRERPVQPAPEEAEALGKTANDIFQSDSGQLDARIIQALLDGHAPAGGYFYGILGSVRLGTFTVAFEPDRPESVVVGRTAANPERAQYFEVWCSFHPRRLPPAAAASRRVEDYRIETTVHADLSMTSEARFRYHASGEDGRVIALDLSSRLRVTGGQIDGKPVEVFQHEYLRSDMPAGSATFLLVADEPLAADSAHSVTVNYEGSVVHQTASASYFVNERNTWYPYVGSMLTTFDLTFHCPESLRLVSTGELIAEEVANGVRTVHRRTQVPEPLAGFNLGRYEVSVAEHGRYRIEFFANQERNPAGLVEQTASVLDYYTARWLPLPIHSLAVSPIEGYFGQGFPGLIYLSSISFIREEDRPAQFRNALLDSFFSEMLLPHEIAHQWWGNMVSQADYRAAWLLEAMSNYSALQYLEQRKGRAAADAVLARYKEDLRTPEKGRALEEAGPVDFGERLLQNDGMRAWHFIVYEKGAWLLHMLRMRLGDDGFHTLQTRILREFQNKQISNDSFRKLAAGLLPAGQTDKTLSLFFDNWVYATGVPKLEITGGNGARILKMSGVEEAFAADIPLRCGDAAGKEHTLWLRATAGDTPFEAPKGSHCELPKQTDYLYFSKD